MTVDIFILSGMRLQPFQQRAAIGWMHTDDM
jgi:hypothetical protein